ncbi:MAG: cation:proton antiporter [Candidatus Aenigmarchaeota archaeon]|nr:cation:proton antiporter [Candidatus Aenigmarchaeota archaeon]
MINTFLFLSLVFALTFLIGKLIEKIRIPWIFAALMIGFVLASSNPFSSITSSDTFIFLAHLGMYFLLFVIGFEIDLKEIKKNSKFIFKATFFTIIFATILAMPVIYYFFNCSWLVSFLVSLSFATVGEAVLIPILDEFRMVNKKIGQSIIGIGITDDIFEVFALVLMVAIIGYNVHTSLHISLILISLFVLFILTIGLTRLKKESEKFHFINIETLFLFSIFILFLFLGVGEYGESAPLAAFLAGISLKTFIPKERLKLIESEVKTVCYGLFAPLFFLWVGVTMNMSYLFSHSSLVLIVVVVSMGAKIMGSYIVGKGELDNKDSLLLGIGLSARFSTSIVIIKILFESNVISSGLYSVIVASTLVLTFLVPILFSWTLSKWKA